MQQIRELQEDSESIQSNVSFSSSLFSWFTVFTRSIVDIAKSYVVSGTKITSSSSVTPSYEGEYDIELGTGPLTSQVKGVLRVDVQDTGPGISKVFSYFSLLFIYISLLIFKIIITYKF